MMEKLKKTNKARTDKAIKAYNRGFNVRFTDANNETYTMSLLGFYLDTRTGKSVDLTSMCRETMQSIVDAARAKTLNDAIGKKLCVTASEKVSGNGKRYTRYTIEAAE